MESFLNKVEREANEEVKRIHREAQQIVDVLKALKLEIPQELQHIVFPVSVEVTSVKEATEKQRKKPDHSKRQAKAEAEYQQVRAEIINLLSKGPRPSGDVKKGIPGPDSRVEKVATRMKKEGELNYRTKGFQGTTEWFLTERPVTLEQLRDEVVDRKGGDIPLGETQTKLGFQREDHLLKMMDELVDQGIIRRTEDDTYENHLMCPTDDRRTLHEKKKYTMIGNGVAGTGRRAKLSASKEVQQILSKAEAMGAQTKKQGNEHIQVKLGDKVAVLSSSPGDNNRANREKLKDLGVNV